MSNLFQIGPKIVSLYKQSGQALTIRCRYNRCYSTEQAVKSWDDDEHNKQLLKDTEKISNIYIKKKIKKPQKPPFLKNILLGKFDADILTYPELEKSELEQLNKDIESTQNYFNNLSPLQNPPGIKSDFIENLRRLNLLGLQGSQFLNAREADVTEDCRFNDIISSQTSTMMGLLCSDKLVFQAILKHGTEEIKKKYLPGLIAGNIIGAFCVSETPNNREGVFNTSASITDDEKTWVLNGEKSYVVNGNTSNLLLVLAKTGFRNRVGAIESKLTLFLVEKNFRGVTTETCDPIGLQATDFANIAFNNTQVPTENILGQLNKAEAILPSILTDFRLGTGPACSGILRKLINQTVKHTTYSMVEKNSLAETDYIQSVVAQLVVDLYAMESTNYLTSMLMDQYEDQDCQMEAIALKIFSSQQTCLSTLNVMEMLGPSAYMKDHWCNVLHRDALGHLILHEPSENLKLTLSLLGLQHTGVNIQEKVNKIRNPLFHPAEAFKRMWYTRKHVNDNPRLTLNLPDYLHPSLLNPAQWLEYCVLRIEFAVESILFRLGKEVMNSHMELLRLAECIIDVYVMTACLGRASRAYCIGLAHADLEMAIAHTFCASALERVRDKLNKICRGPYSTNDENYKRIATNLFKAGEYFPVHPLTRNY